MRPVNLIPPEERRGTAAASRTGRAPYFVLGGLAAFVAMFALYVSASSSVKDAEAEVASLEKQELEATARAEALRPFATFASTREAREQTISSLARSRFDWERVMDELSRVVPADVWLSELSATVSPAVTVGGPQSSLRPEVDGPALTISGCGRSHDAVATMISALEDIDGVTRVTAENSEKGEKGGGGGAACQTRSSIASFTAVAAFDEVTVPEAETVPVPDASAGAAAAPVAEVTP